MLDARNFLRDTGNLFEHRFGSLQRRAVWQLGQYNQVSLVLGGDKPARNDLETQASQE